MLTWLLGTLCCVTFLHQTKSTVWSEVNFKLLFLHTINCMHNVTDLTVCLHITDADGVVWMSLYCKAGAVWTDMWIIIKYSSIYIMSQVRAYAMI